MISEDEMGKRIQELQILEQNLQGFVMQKQVFQIELNEILNALEEIEKTKDEVYKILGGVMIKSDKGNVIKEFEEKKRVLELRINSLEKQEKLIESKAREIKQEIERDLSTKKKKER